MIDSLLVGREGTAQDAVRRPWHRAWLGLWPRLDTRGWQNAGLLCALVVLQLVGAVLTPLDGAGGDALGDLLCAAGVGASLAPPTLLALWAVLGPGRAVVRLPATLWLATAVYVSVVYGEHRSDGPGHESFLFSTAWILAYSIVQLPLWLLRAVRRWRLELTADPERPDPVAEVARFPTQSDHHFTLRSLLAWTLAAAALLAVMRHSMPETAPGLQTVLDALPYIGLGGLMLTVAGLPIVALAGILLATGRRPKLRAVLVALVAAGLAGGIPLCLCLMEESDDWPYFAGIEAGTILNGLASLLVIWACGYRFKQRAKWNLNAALTAQLAPAPAVRVPLSPRRLAVALATLLLMAAVVAYAAPKRAEEWRQAAIAAEWIKRGFHVGFNDDGALDSVYYRDGSAITDEILKQISAEQSLTMLDLARARIDDRQLALLAPLTNLAHLHLSNCDISDDGLAIVARFGHLQHLVLDNTQVTDAGLAPLLNLPFLQSLSLSVTEVTDDGLDILSRLPQLDHLDVSLTAVTTSAAQRFYQAHPSVRIQAGSTDQHLEYWLSTRGVIAEEVISTDYETLMVFSEAVHLKTAPIKRLHLRGGKTPNGAVFSVTDASLPILADRPELEELDLRDAAITDWGLHELAKLQALKRLDLRGTAVSDRAIARLVKSLPDCEILAPR